MKRLIFVLAALLVATAAAAQTVKNPTKAIFTSPDAANVTGYELDIINEAGAVVQTMTFPATPADPQGEVTLVINVQPVNFGKYTSVVRAIYQAVKSINSNTSDVWERAPGQPSKPKMN
jgi:hypothetical protein